MPGKQCLYLSYFFEHTVFIYMVEDALNRKLPLSEMFLVQRIWSKSPNKQNAFMQRLKWNKKLIN